MSRTPHKPTDAMRQTVEQMSAVGITHEDISAVIGIDDKTLRKYYRTEIDTAKAKANASIGGALYNKAKGGDTTAMIFWMKTRAGWKEKSHLELTGEDGKPLTIVMPGKDAGTL